MQWRNALDLLARQTLQPTESAGGATSSSNGASMPRGGQQSLNNHSLGNSQSQSAQSTRGGLHPWSSGSAVGVGGSTIPASARWSYALSLLQQQQQRARQGQSPWPGPCGTNNGSLSWESPQLPTPVPSNNSQLGPEVWSSSMSETTSQMSLSTENSLTNPARLLYKVCQDGNVTEVDRLLRDGIVDPDCRNPRGATPLFAASHGNHVPVMKLLLAAQADPDRTNNDGVSPVFIAAQKNSMAAVHLLLQARADPDRSRKDRATPAFIAAANNSFASLGLLLRARADPGLANKNGDTPLTIAAYSCNLEAIRLLITFKANVNAPGYQGQETALECAQRAQDAAVNDELKAKADGVIEALLAAGAICRESSSQSTTGKSLSFVRSDSLPTPRHLASKLAAGAGAAATSALGAIRRSRSARSLRDRPSLSFVQPPWGTPRCGMVWLHGLGDKEATWAGILQDDLRLPSQLGPCKFVFPRAPVQMATCNGRRTTSWFDMQKLPLTAQDAPPKHGCSLEQALASTELIHTIVDQLVQEGVPPERVLVGGFSQGGALALLSAITYRQRLAGVVIFSGLVFFQEGLEKNMPAHNRGLDVFWGHGDRDEVLDATLQSEGVAALVQVGARVRARSYAVAHSWMQEEMTDAAAFCAERLRAPPPE